MSDPMSHLLGRLRRLALALVWLAGPLAATPATAADAPRVAGRADCPPLAVAPSAQAVERARQQARDRGLLWRLERDGHVSWLYGTIHVGRLEWTFPGPALTAALRQAKALALELDIANSEVQQQLAQAQARLDARAPRRALPAALAARLERQIAAACADPAVMAGQSPVMQVVTLSVLAARRDGLDPAYAQEFVLAGLARATGAAVHSLETPAQQLEALADVSDDEQRALVAHMLAQLDSGRARETLARLARAWDDGDLDTLANYDRWCDCAGDDTGRAFLARLNDDRNPALADGIAALHAQAGSLVAAVGALHMTGARALPTLLRERGFKVERIR